MEGFTTTVYIIKHFQKFYTSKVKKLEPQQSYIINKRRDKLVQFKLALHCSYDVARSSELLIPMILLLLQFFTTGLVFE